MDTYYENVLGTLMNHDISNVWGNGTLFHQAKSIEKNIEKRQILT